MKKPSILSIVVVAHCLAIGGIVLMGGCGTPRGKLGGDVAPAPVMPPSLIETIPSAPVNVGPAITDWPLETTTYVVRKGDSLSIIAKHYGVSVSEMVALNGLSNKNVIRVGQKLKLPGKVDVGAPRPAVKTTESRKTSGGNVAGGTYVVQPGDCLSVIASKNGVTAAAIREANGLSGDKIVVGQKLVLPGVSTVKQDAPDVSSKSAVKPELIVRDKEPSSVKGPSAVKVTVPDVADAVVTEKADDEGAAEESAVKIKPVITETHVVQKGEDLRRISMQWLVDEEKIRAFNNLPKNVVLKPGQTLQIPLSE